jgi:DGQHR domain-containing protein
MEMKMVSYEKLNPVEGHILAGVRINSHVFLARIRARQLMQLTPDPRLVDNPQRVKESRELQVMRSLRGELQREFQGAKAKNVPKYAEYILGLSHGMEGLTPPIILYSEQALPTEVSESGAGAIQVPYFRRLVAIDGETQLAARFEAANRDGDTESDWVPVMITHGRPKDWARQCFHDLNVLGIRPNAAVSVGMDNRDPLTAIARGLEEKVPFLEGRVSKTSRTIGKDSQEVVTLSALRGAVVTVAEGIKGVGHGLRPVAIEDPRKVQEVAEDWFKVVLSHFSDEIMDRKNYIMGSPASLAALGAVGHALMFAKTPHERVQMEQVLLHKLRKVNWKRGAHWSGVAGKVGPKGELALAGTKEAAHAIYNAIMDEDSPSYRSVRVAA